MNRLVAATVVTPTATLPLGSSAVTDPRHGANISHATTKPFVPSVGGANANVFAY
jgi:hypothetical protein